MIAVNPQDDQLETLLGETITAEMDPAVGYRIERLLGVGGTCSAFFATRQSPEGSCPVVLKIVRPGFARQSPHALLVVKKEAVALGRLNERIPPTPFVVRLVDAGSLPVEHAGKEWELPWLALEYVHGGSEGTTLTERLKASLTSTSAAFEPERAAQAVDCLTHALAAVHDVGVVHRDIKPDNVLCCGFGDQEIFKIADFGVARPTGMAGTFRGALFGTPGYAAPELQAGEADSVGPWSDVFGLAAVVFFLLTGEEYFPAHTPQAHIIRVATPERRSLLEVPTLGPELRAREADCRIIDAELAHATAVESTDRQHDVLAFGAAVLRGLLPVSVGRRGFGRAAPPRSRDSRLDDIIQSSRTVDPTTESWRWTVRHRAPTDLGIRAASWDGDARCLALSAAGLHFWDGTDWRRLPTDGLPPSFGIRCVHRAGPGHWLLGGTGATIAAFAATESGNILNGADASVSYELLSGDLDDLGIALAKTAAGSLELHARVGGWWLKPLPVDPGVANVRAIKRLARARWLLAGDSRDGSCFAATYAPLDWELERIDLPGSKALGACAAHPDRHVGLAVGCQGTMLWLDHATRSLETVEAADLTAAAVDALGRGWAAGAGHLWQRSPAPPDVVSADGGQPWRCVWEESSWTAPVVSMFADVGRVVAVAADGSILEGSLDTG